MFGFNNLKSIEVEITNRCQAKCPMCSRNYHSGIPNNLFKNVEWNLDDFKKILSEEVLMQIKHLNFCGGLGDPLMVKDFLDIISYVKKINPMIKVDIHTNASLRTTTFWKNLPKRLPKNHTVYFGIDGFSDTHSLYRIGTNWNKIIDNAKTFIKAGGNAEAHFIQFKHNQHQYKDLEKFLLDIGFNSVDKIVTERFKTSSQFSVLGKDGSTLYNLESCIENVDIGSEAEFENLLQDVETLEKNMTNCCESLTNNSIYIDAYKCIFPCCYIATNRYQMPIIGEHALNKRLPRIKKEIAAVIKDLEKENLFSLDIVSIKSILNNPEYLKIWHRYWIKQKLLLCNLLCGLD